MTTDGGPVMSSKRSPNERAFQQASILVAIGLMIEGITLYFNHPAAFLTFIGFGTLLVAAGIVRYLWAAARSAGQGSGDRS